MFKLKISKIYLPLLNWYLDELCKREITIFYNDRNKLVYLPTSLADILFLSLYAQFKLHLKSDYYKIVRAQVAQ